MLKFRLKYPIPIFVIIVSALLSYWLQRYRLVELEECYIFLYDSSYALTTASRPGGTAMLIGSFATQFMASPWAGAAIAGLYYGLISLAMTAFCRRIGGGLLSSALSLATVICLFLCLENNSYKFQGHAAMLLAMAWLYAYAATAGWVGSITQAGRPTPPSRTWLRIVFGAIIAFAAYASAGSAAIVTVVGMAVCDIKRHRRLWWSGLIYIAIVLAAGYAAWRLQLVPTLKRALTPAMYYEWDTTAFMMLYAWCAALICIIAAALPLKGRANSAFAVTAAVLLLLGAGARTYTLIHTPGVYRTMQQRYYAKIGDWDAILALDYGDAPTPFTSYRFLALAQKGRLVDQLSSTRPFIDYFMKNRTLVKKEDLEVLSDIYYACDYMAAARHFAFDTNIVTPGEFNPHETLKLAEINILTGDYAVAEKYLSQLEKTLNYRDRARHLRRFMHNPEALKADPVMAAKLAAIPADDAYLSPKGTLRDLRAIVAANPDQQVARQFLETFIILTNYKEQ